MPATERWAGALPWVAFVLGAATIAYGAPRGEELGSVNAPFWVTVRAGVDWSLAWVAVGFAAGIAVALALCSPRAGPVPFGLGATALALVLRLGLNAVPGGTAAWKWPFAGTWLAEADYLPALPFLRWLGAGPFLDHFADFAGGLPVHPSAHPPGALLLLHWTGVDTAAAWAALAIGGGVIAVPLTYVVARGLLDERRARWAALLVAFSPASLLYGVTSADALFATVALLAGAALLSARRWLRALGPPLVAVASFFSYPLPAVSVWALALRARRAGLRSALGLAVACALALAGFYGLLAVFTGFDLFATLASAEDAYRASSARERPYAFWLLGSPTAFLVALGLPITWFALRGAVAGETGALVVVGLMAFSAVLGFTKAETERIWLFFVAPACIAAAAQLRGRLGAVLLGLSVQALAVQALIDTRY